MNKVISPETIKYIKSCLSFQYDGSGIPGYSVAISHNGKLILNEAYGFSDLEKNKKLTSGNIFSVASHSKTFTATVIMQLVEEGKLRLDDKLSDYLVWLKDHKDKRFLQITIRQVMSHGSGMIRNGLDASFWGLDRAFPDRDEAKKATLEAGLAIDNNIRMKYSNWGYALLGLLIEEITNKPYNDVVTEKIIKPLGLENTYPDYLSELKDKMAVGYSRKQFGSKRLPIDNIATNSMSPATGFCSTAADLCRYFSAHMIGSNELLNDESKKEMQKGDWKTVGDGSDSSYGLGMTIGHVRNHKIVGHGGGFPGYMTDSLFDEKNKLVVVVLTNCIGAYPFRISRGIFNAIDHLEGSKFDEVAHKKLSKFTGRFADLWGATDIVFCCNRLVATHPYNWVPFSGAYDLSYVDENTLRIDSIGSYGNGGENLKFVFDGNQIKSVCVAGQIMLPIKDWEQKQKSRDIVTLPK